MAGIRKGEAMEKRFEYAVQLAAVSILVVGCYLVLQPFLAAMLLAAVICISTWHFYQWLLRKMNGWRTLAALIATLLLILVIIVPFSLAAYSLASQATIIFDAIKRAVETAPGEPPAWLQRVPLLGEIITDYWHEITASQQEMLALVKKLLDPIRRLLLTGGIVLGRGVMQMSLAAFVAFFFYRDGATVVRLIGGVVQRAIGLRAEGVIRTVVTTVRAVMFGVLGTALVQGIVATIGFAIAHVPAPMLLGLVTFLFALIPIGPPIIWLGAAIWLFSTGAVGWGIFMLVWGFFAISSVDNVVKPLLISRGADLPFILGLFGVIGGVLAFGFVGIFIGPTLLAVGLCLIKEWAGSEAPNNPRKPE